MHLKITRFTLLFFIIFANLNLCAQIKIKNYSAGYKVFYIDGVGNNPTTIASIMKDPVAYQDFLNRTQYNGLSGGGGIQDLKTFYFNTELYKAGSLSNFWKKYSIQTGVLLSSKLVKNGLAVERRDYSPNDSTLYINTYSLVQKQQFLGANLGVNRRFTLSKKILFVLGFQYQASFAFFHRYGQRLDSSSVSPANGRVNKTTVLPDLNAKNFYQWQAMIPFGLEWQTWQKQFAIRFEGEAGLIGSRYRPKRGTYPQAWGLGFWLIYKPS